LKKSTSNDKEKVKSLWKKCPSCDQIIYKKDLEENYKICPKCDYYLRMTAKERLALLLDKKQNGSLNFDEFDSNFCSEDPLHFTDPGNIAPQASRMPAKKSITYLQKIKHEQKKTGQNDAVLCGMGMLGGTKVVLAVMDFYFMGGSMGSVVGEKVTRSIEKAFQEKCPLILVSASGGARMQEGILSLMQMAKTSAAIARLQAAKTPVISILCDPTTGGVTASFAMLGDILIAEPKALIAFAGPRVIEQTIRQQLPVGFQQSEFLMKHGLVDCIVERKDLKDKLITFIKIFSHNKQPAQVQ